MRPALEVADVFRTHGPAWRRAQAGRLSLGQLKVMSAIEACRTAELGGHVSRCADCDHVQIAYNSCRNRHCPRCQGAAAQRWLEARQAELLPLAYYHVVFTLPAQVAEIAFHNKAAVYDLLFNAASQTLLTIAADPKHLGARIGLTAVLHTWGSALTHHPHVYCIVPGGGLSPDGERWVSCRPWFFLPVRVLSRLFRRLFLDGLAAAHADGRVVFFGDLAPLTDHSAFTARLAPLRRAEWVVHAKRPFAGPESVLAYLARYTHRVAISSSRLVSLDERGVTFYWKDYRRQGPDRRKLMTLDASEFMRRFLIHLLPGRFHRIRHYGLSANPSRAANLARARALLQAGEPPSPQSAPEPEAFAEPSPTPCPCCGGAMRLVEIFERGCAPRTSRPGRRSGSTAHDHRLGLHPRRCRPGSPPGVPALAPPSGAPERLPREARLLSLHNCRRASSRPRSGTAWTPPGSLHVRTRTGPPGQIPIVPPAIPRVRL